MQKILEINNYLIKQTINLIIKNNFINNDDLSIGKIIKEFCPLQIKRKTGFYNNIFIQKIINFSLIGNRQFIESENIRNDPQVSPINYEINNCKNYFSETSYNLAPEENNKIHIFEGGLQRSLNINSSKKYYHIIKLKYFEIKKFLYLE